MPDCDSFDIRIARDGTWYYRGTPIGRKALVKLFSTVIKRDDHGNFWLETPVEKGRIQVDDAPFVAVELAVIGGGRDQVLRFRSNVDEWIEAGPEHPIRVETRGDTGEPRPYILVRDRLEALILRSVFYEMVELAEERRPGDRGDGKRGGVSELGLWSKGHFFPLGSPD
ncbi:MAG: DUF1285 domain-containing protein [Kiloniellales bacterium]